MTGAMKHTKWWATAGLTACLATAGVVAATGAGAGESGPGATSEAEAADRPTVQAVGPAQANRIGELRREPTAADALPDRWSATIEAAAERGQTWGANPKLARRTAPDVWLVPGDGYLCLASTSPGDGSFGFGCASDEHVGQGLLAPSDVDQNGSGVLTGVVPDGIASVELIDLDGSARTVTVARNTYRAAIDADLKEVRFTDADGGRHVLPMEWKR